MRTRVSSRHHLHFASLQSVCATSKEGNKWCKGIYIPSERGCWSVRFHLLLRGVGVQGSCCGMEGSSLGPQVGEGHSQLCSQPFPGVLARRCSGGRRPMCQAVQDASIHPAQGGLSGKTTLQGQLDRGGAPNQLLCSRTLWSGLGVSSHPGLPWAWRVLALPFLLCQLPAKSLWALTGSQGTECPGSPCGTGAPSLLFTPLSLLNSLVQNCSGRGRRLDLDLTVLEALAVLDASKTKTFLRLHLEQEKVFPLGFYSSRKAGFYFCCLRQKNPLRS